MLRFEKATPGDAVILGGISKRAFNNDIHYGGSGEGGPTGYDSAEGQISWMNNAAVTYYKILSGDKIIGGIIVGNAGNGKFYLVRIFIEPELQNQGIGTKAMEFIFRELPEAKVWITDTPAWNKRTCHFYEKLGFKVSSIDDGEVWFEKRVNELRNVTKEESKEVENMTNPTKLTNGPARVVLEGVPRIGFDIGLCTFPASLRACMEFVGEDYSYDYIMGTSGAAFRLLWKPGWWLDNVSITLMADDLEPIRRAIEAVGYTYGVVLKEDFARQTYFNGEYCDDEAYFRSRIMESISDKGHPVIAFGVVGPPECSIITGYDEYSDVLIGWSFFQGSASAPEPGVEYEPSGYYRKRNWFKDTPGIIIIGEKQERHPLGKTYRKALEWALEVMRTPMVHDRHNGFAAYNAWAEALLRDEDFSPGDEGIGLRANVHNDALCMLDERLCGARFLRQMAKDEPEMADELLAAAACYETENKNSGIIDVLGKRITEPAIRRQFAELILQSRDKDEEAADHIERALTMEGSEIKPNS